MSFLINLKEPSMKDVFLVNGLDILVDPIDERAFFESLLEEAKTSVLGDLTYEELFKDRNSMNLYMSRWIRVFSNYESFEYVKDLFFPKELSIDWIKANLETLNKKAFHIVIADELTDYELEKYLKDAFILSKVIEISESFNQNREKSRESLARFVKSAKIHKGNWMMYSSELNLTSLTEVKILQRIISKYEFSDIEKTKFLKSEIDAAEPGSAYQLELIKNLKN